MPLDETRFFVQSLCNSWRRYHLPPSAQSLNSPPIISNHRDYQRKFSQQQGREHAITVALAQYGKKRGRLHIKFRNNAKLSLQPAKQKIFVGGEFFDVHTNAVSPFLSLSEYQLQTTILFQALILGTASRAKLIDQRNTFFFNTDLRYYLVGNGCRHDDFLSGVKHFADSSLGNRQL